MYRTSLSDFFRARYRPAKILARIFPLLARIVLFLNDTVISNDRYGLALRTPTNMDPTCRYRPIVSFGKVGGSEDPPVGVPSSGRFQLERRRETATSLRRDFRIGTRVDTP